MLLASLMSCTPDTVVLEDREPHVQTVWDGPVDAVATGAASVVTVAGSEWQWLDARAQPTAVSPLADLPTALASHAGDSWMLASSVHVMRKGTPEPVGLEELLSNPPTDLCSDGSMLWLPTEAGTFVWQRGAVSNVVVDGAPAVGPLACGGRLHHERVAWLATGATVHAVATNGATWAVFESVDFDEPVHAVAVDAQGGAWVAAGTTLHHRDGNGWAEVPLDAPVWTLLGGPAGTGVWVVTEAGLRWADGSTVVRPTSDRELQTLGRWQADALGRLVLRDESGVRRVSMDRPLWIGAPRDGATLAEPFEIDVVPTAPEELVELVVQLGDGPLELIGGTAFADPETYTTGDYTLRVVARYPDHTVVAERVYQLQSPGSVTWKGHVQPLHEQACALCHTSAAETLLRDAAEWQANIDDILTNVDSGAMPLGGPPLSPAERGLIRAWRDGGFP